MRVSASVQPLLLVPLVALAAAAARGEDRAGSGGGTRQEARRAAPPDRVLVPAGSFLRGSTKGDEDERPAGTKVIAAFRIDRTEVARGAYARCVAARRCPAPPFDPTVDPELPMTNVTWQEARAYCAFAGGRLPTEAEWEKAARGVDGRTFPWGDDADCARANWGNFDGEGPCAGTNPGRPLPVGQRQGGASPYGALDMAGNVWEWVQDLYEASYDERPRPRRRGDDGDEPERRVVRGGSCCSYFVPPRAANRNAWAADHRDGDLGFRCVAPAR
jgi:serine/threonine-protein kinase